MTLITRVQGPTRIQLFWLTRMQRHALRRTALVPDRQALVRKWLPNLSWEEANQVERIVSDSDECVAIGCDQPTPEKGHPFCEKHNKDEELWKAWNEL